MTPLRLTMKTEDRDLLKQINDFKNDDLKISVYTTDAIPSPEEIALTVIISITSSVSAGLILKLLEKHFSNKPAKKTTINGINIENNSTPVFIEINNYIQKQQKDEENGKKDEGKPEIIESGGVKYYAKKIE